MEGKAHEMIERVLATRDGAVGGAQLMYWPHISGPWASAGNKM